MLVRGSDDGQRGGCDDGRMAGKRRRSGLLDAYRRLRKPMPPPERIERDRRRELEDERARREIDEGREERR